MTQHEWHYNPGTVPVCKKCGRLDPLWYCALEHGEHCAREECRPFPCDAAVVAKKAV